MTDLKTQALTHKSWAEEHGGPHNERLEFLGDAVLQACVSELLYRRFPDHPEGELTDLRKNLVNNEFLAERARAEGVPGELRLGAGEAVEGRDKVRILAGAFEALIGAAFLEGGFEAARARVEASLGPWLDSAPADNPVVFLQSWAQRVYKKPPDYSEVGHAGPDHRREFTSEVSLDGRVLGRGVGSSKKNANRAAAQNAIDELGLVYLLQGGE